MGGGIWVEVVSAVELSNLVEVELEVEASEVDYQISAVAHSVVAHSVVGEKLLHSWQLNP